MKAAEPVMPSAVVRHIAAGVEPVFAAVAAVPTSKAVAVAVSPRAVAVVLPWVSGPEAATDRVVAAWELP